MDKETKNGDMEKITSSALVDALKDYYKDALSKSIASELIVELNRRIEESKQAMELYEALIESLNSLSDKNDNEPNFCAKIDGKDTENMRVGVKVESDGQGQGV